MKLKPLATLLAFAAGSTAAFGQIPVVQKAVTPIALSADAGTTGLGATLWVTVTPQITVSAGYAGIKIDRDYSSDGTDYNGKLKLSNGMILLNWHPLGRSFRVAAGAVIADNTATVTGKPGPGATYTIDGTTYPAALVGTITGRADVGKSAAPYVGIGWAKSPEKSGIGVFVDLGAMFAGSSKVALSANGPLATDPTFQSHLRQEERDVNDDLDNFKIYPVARIGIMFRF